MGDYARARNVLRSQLFSRAVGSGRIVSAVHVATRRAHGARPLETSLRPAQKAVTVTGTFVSVVLPSPS